MKKNLLLALLLSATLLSMNSCSSSDSTDDQTAASTEQLVTNYDYTAKELELANIINVYRVSKGLNALILVNHISHISEGHDQYMIERNVISHDLFQSRFQNLVSVLGADRVGENIAYNFNLPQSALTAWLNSPGHKANIEGDFTHCGISIRENANGIKYYTNMFMKK